MTLSNFTHPYFLASPNWADAVHPQSCRTNLPEGVDPDNLIIIAGFTCHSC